MEVRNLAFSYNKNNKELIHNGKSNQSTRSNFRGKNSLMGGSSQLGSSNLLEGLSFTITNNKITTLIGANGCGKSTIFQLMTKNLIPDKGEVLLEGRNIQYMKQKEFARNVAIVHQNNQVTSDITVRKLISYGRTPHLGIYKQPGQEDEDIIDWAMEVTQVERYQKQPVLSLSGGQKQRVFIAMALAQKTKYLFLDEPTTYLDIRYQIEILEMIWHLNKTYNITIVMVLHDMNHAIYYSDEVIGMKEGKVILHGDPKEIITSKNIKDIYGIELEVREVYNRKVVMTVRS